MPFGSSRSDDADSEPPAGGSGVGGDLSRIFSPRSLRFVLAGATLAAASRGIEDPVRAASILDGGAWDGGLDVGNAYGGGATLAAGSLALIAAGHLGRAPHLTRTGWKLARSLAYTGAIVTALKVGFDRTRPNGGPYSFPSGHSAAAFAAAPILAEELGGGAAIPAYLLASAAALGRLEDRKHYLSDVVFGAAIGLAVGTAVAHPGDGRGAAPSLSVGPGVAALTVRF